MEFAITMIIMTVIICITVNIIHKRNKKSEVIKEAIKNGYKVDAVL